MREFTTSFPDFHVDVIDVLVDDDAVAVEVRYTMTHEGEFNDIPPTGRTVDVGGMGKLLLEDGKVTEHREFHDQLEVLEQLGVLEE
jgi:predicted ester cyclase